MAYNRIAVYGHRGWASSAIVDALVASGAPIKVLYRPGSDVASLPRPSNVTSVEVDLADEEAVVSSLQDVDILISLVGHEGVERQMGFVKALPKTDVKLFVPSDLGMRCDEQGLRIPVNKHKAEVEKAAKEAGVNTCVVLPGFFVESSIAFPILGVDVRRNRIIFTGESAEKRMNLCTRKYVAAAFVSIFATTPPSQLANRAIGLSELTPSGREVAAALEKKHGAAPQILAHSIEKVDAEIENGIKAGRPLTLSWYCRKTWGTGLHVEAVGSDIWEVEGYRKLTLEELIVGGQMEGYREMPPPVLEAVLAAFH
ncbi:hypothetical protein B0H11DRAFT_2007756 [Mycena galericulata]|nr:hypothetical protein B0H11DRAFT_2007756 [Mycena galericulata]